MLGHKGPTGLLLFGLLYKPASEPGTSETLGKPAAMVVSMIPVRRSKTTLSSDAICTSCWRCSRAAT